jgi:hypothetical protein
MSAEIECRKCGNNLEPWNNGRSLRINYCPFCGTKVLKKQGEALRCKTTVEEVSDIIRGHLLDLLDTGGDIPADELADRAWESEVIDGTVFYNNYNADLFVFRHLDWVDRALDYICENFGEPEHYVKMKAECNDRFLVAAFLSATERYVFDHLGIDPNGGRLTKKRAAEIKRLIKTNPYNGEF